MSNSTANKNEKKEFVEKKPLKDVLVSYFEKKQDMKKIKKDFADLELDLKKSQTSYETLVEIQKKLNMAYNKINNGKNEKQKIKKDH